MKGYTQIKKEDIIKAIENFEQLQKQSKEKFVEFKLKATQEKQEYTVGWWIFKRKEMMTAFEYWTSNGMFWEWLEVAPGECTLYLRNTIDTTEYKQQSLIAEEYVNCDTELSSFVYKYLNIEE